VICCGELVGFQQRRRRLLVLKAEVAAYYAQFLALVEAMCAYLNRQVTEGKDSGLVMSALWNTAGYYIFALWFLLLYSLWSPYVIGQTIIFSSCFFFFLLSSLWSPYVIGRPYIFSSCDFYLSSFFLLSFFSSPNLSGHRLDLYHTSTHGVALVRI